MSSRYRDYKEKRKITMDDMLSGGKDGPQNPQQFKLDETQIEQVRASVMLHEPVVMENLGEEDGWFCRACNRVVGTEGCYTWSVVRPAVQSVYDLPISAVTTYPPVGFSEEV